MRYDAIEYALWKLMELDEFTISHKNGEGLIFKSGDFNWDGSAQAPGEAVINGSYYITQRVMAKKAIDKLLSQQVIDYSHL